MTAAPAKLVKCRCGSDATVTELVTKQWVAHCLNKLCPHKVYGRTEEETIGHWNAIFGEKQYILFTCDRDRHVDYNGTLLKMNAFMCATCRHNWVGEPYNRAKHCPECGVKFNVEEDISV